MYLVLTTNYYLPNQTDVRPYGGIAGGVVGGSLANSQRKKMQASKPTDNKKDDADEGEEDTNDGEQLKSKAAALAAVLAR